MSTSSRRRRLGAVASCAGLLVCLAATPLRAEEGESNGEPEIGLRWALSAMEGESATPSSIQADTQLSAGDRLKFLVEPLTPCSVYLVLLDSSDTVHVLYRESTKPSEDGGKRTYIPPGGQWFEVDNESGAETFFLLASAEPLAELDTLLDANEKGASKESADKIVAEIRRLHKAHRNFARPVEKPMMIGGQTRGVNSSSIDRLAVEVSAERFYAKTITIEH